LTQATRHGRLAILPEIRRLNSPGMPTGLATSSWAPVSEMLRTTQSMVPPLNSMVPAFKVRCRGAARLFSRFRSSSVLAARLRLMVAPRPVLRRAGTRPRCLFGEPGPDPGPGDLEPKLAVLEIDRGSAVIGRRRLSVDVAAPPPMRVTGRLHDPADRQPAPSHLVVIFLLLPVSDGRTQSNGFRIVGHHQTCLQPACSAAADDSGSTSQSGLHRLPEPVCDRIRTTYRSGAFTCAKTGFLSARKALGDRSGSIRRAVMRRVCGGGRRAWVLVWARARSAASGGSAGHTTPSASTPHRPQHPQKKYGGQAGLFLEAVLAVAVAIS